MAPQHAAVRQADGTRFNVQVASVALGAFVRVRPGERVPMDGVVFEGNSGINQAPVTGESIPVDEAVGDTVFAGTINETGTFKFKVTAIASSFNMLALLQLSRCLLRIVALHGPQIILPSPRIFPGPCIVPAPEPQLPIPGREAAQHSFDQ